ncbi:MAG: aminoacetone oxidase family FAD-binding enzyme [Clostridia bacterium]|nr:aminoacetone oxidase family FAD-binding enzyme [Clostridia bacterium]
MSYTYEIAIVGGGASGLAAAVFCAREGGKSIVLLEKQPRVGKKLLATGSGTCNLTNRTAAPDNYHGDGASAFVTPALTAFPPEAALAFFRSLGVLCSPREEGREYPLCQQASAVLDCLRLELSRLGVTERCDAAITAIKPQNGGFVLSLANGETVTAERVILAAGGAASPSLGGSSDGYALATALGHRKTPLFPAIVQVRTDTTFVRAMKGLRTDATVTFCLNGQPLCSHTDELLFTEYGISGPAVMQISRVVGDWERRKTSTMTAVIDLLPTVSETELLALLAERRALGRTAADFLTGILNKRIGQTVCRAAGLSLEQPTETLSPNVLRKLAETIKRFTLPVIGTQGFGGAQVTAGGIATAEVDPRTMMSRRVPGLYLIGEVLDVDGDCGGFNLQWAWASAYVAAKAVTQ